MMGSVSMLRIQTDGAEEEQVPEVERPRPMGPLAGPPFGLRCLALCPDSCSSHVWCMTGPAGLPLAQPFCHCFEPWEGPSCAARVGNNNNRFFSDTGLNKCSHRGRCEAGVCLCDAGTWGVDCSLPLVAERAEADIYVYELPPGFNVWWPHQGGRGIGRMLIEYLLRSPYRTADPAKAKVFWVPVELMGPVSHGYAVLALDYVRREFPFYNRSGGRDHAMVFAWDSGSCWVAKQPLVADTIQISSFGLPHADRKMSYACAMCGAGFTLLVPDVVEQDDKRRSPMRYGHPDDSPRPNWIFFSGSPSGEERVQLFNLTAGPQWAAALSTTHRSRGPVKVINTFAIGGPIPLAEEVLKAKYCLAPPGAGFGTRGTLAILLGCVPIYIGELRQPFDDIINYSSFSLRVPTRELPRLLDHIAAADYEALRRGVGRVWHMFHWASMFGPLGGEPLEHDAMHLMLAGVRKLAAQRGGAHREHDGMLRHAEQQGAGASVL